MHSQGNESWSGKDKLVEMEQDLDGFIFIFLAVQCTSKEVACNQPKCGLRGWRNKKNTMRALCVRTVFRVFHSEQFLFPSLIDCLHAALHPQLAVEIVDMGLNRAQCDDQPLCDLLVR